MANQMPPVAQFSLPKGGEQQPSQPTTPVAKGIPPIAQFKLPESTTAKTSPQQTGYTPSSAGVPIGGNLSTNLARIPGDLKGAANSLLPAVGDVYHDVTGTNKKTVLQQVGDVGTTALTAASLVPGVDLLDVGILGGKKAAEGVAAKAPGLISRLARGAAVGGAYGATGALGAGSTDPTQIGISTAEGAAGGAATEGLLSKVIPATAGQKLQSAIEDAIPSYDKSLIGSDKTASGKPRVEEGGILGTRKVNPTASEVEAGTEGANIPNYPFNGTALEKYNSVQPEIAKEGQALMTSLENEKILRPPQELKAIVNKAVQEAAGDSLLLQKADPAVKNYQRVAARAIDQSPGTLAGEMQVRRALDNAYEDAGGKYSNNKALDQIHRAARNALTDDMESKATNTAVKASLKKQSNLYRFEDALLDKAKTEGGSKFEQLTKRHPKAAGLIKTGIGLTGLKNVVLPFIP